VIDDVNMLIAEYLKNACRQTLASKGQPLGNGIW